MDATVQANRFVEDVRRRCYGGERVFWLGEGELGVFDVDAAETVNAANYADLTLPDRLGDLLRGRAGAPLSWQRMRSAWAVRLRELSSAPATRRLADDMAGVLDRDLDRPCDLVHRVQDACIESLLAFVIDGMTPAARRHVLSDQHFKLGRLLGEGPAARTLRNGLRSVLTQLRAGHVVRGELRGRARGRRARRTDLLDAVVDLLPELGLDRAVDAVTTLLTAIAGPPGAAATCLLYEWTRRPAWAARVEAELQAVPEDAFHAAPLRTAPVAHRFVKEVLRLWASPMFLKRPVRTAIRHGGVELKPGQHYVLSPYLAHRDPRRWPDADGFDPDRWRPEAKRAGCPAASDYLPFGWAPLACIGAHLGLTQMVVLCRLLATRYRVELADPAGVSMAYRAVIVPTGFVGSVRRR
jgi:cytochrome P450